MQYPIILEGAGGICCGKDASPQEPYPAEHQEREADHAPSGGAHSEMKPDLVCDHERPEDEEVHVLDPAAQSRRQRADREHHEAVIRPEQAVHEGDHREHNRASDARCGQCGEP